MKLEEATCDLTVELQEPVYGLYNKFGSCIFRVGQMASKLYLMVRARSRKGDARTKPANLLVGTDRCRP